MAMLLAEALDEPDFRSRVKIYATDVDERRARAGAARGLRAEGRRGRAGRRCKTRYFELQDGRYVFRPDAPPGRDLRSPRPRARPADLAGRPAPRAQHAHVLQPGAPGAHPRLVPLRAERRRVPLPREVGDAADTDEALRSGRPEAARLREDRRRDGAAATPAAGRCRPAAVGGGTRRAAAGGIRGDSRRGLRDRRGRDAHTGKPARSSALPAQPGRPRASDPGSRGLLPAARAPLPPRRGGTWDRAGDRSRGRDHAWRRGLVVRRRVDAARRRRRQLPRHDRDLRGLDAAPPPQRQRRGRAGAHSRRRTRSSSRPRRSSRRRTRSSSRPTRSSRRRTRSSSRPTRSSRR